MAADGIALDEKAAHAGAAKQVGRRGANDTTPDDDDVRQTASWSGIRRCPRTCRARNRGYAA
jgi:hypothetical protein